MSHPSERKLNQWLDKHEARPLWSSRTPNGTLKAYLVNGQILLALIYSRGDGWDIFVPASSDNDVEATLRGAKIALGLD